jgi:hypothetical protein
MNRAKLSQKDAFLKYLQSMDIEMLEIVLDDSITYFGTSKQVFLKKLSYIFDQYRLSGENSKLRLKQSKTQHNTYYLLLPTFCFANKFIIEEKANKILKIYGDKIRSTKEEIENLSPLELFFGDDEKVDFHSSTEYVMTLYRCTNAYEEMVNGQLQFLTKDDISHWIDKHTLLYEEVQGEFLLFKYNDFRNLFFMFKNLLDGLQNFNEVQKALKSFSDTNITLLQKWLVDYNRLAFCKVLSFENNFRDINFENKTLKFNYCPSICFSGDEFMAIVKFNELYHNYFDNFLEK